MQALTLQQIEQSGVSVLEALQEERAGAVAISARALPCAIGRERNHGDPRGLLLRERVALSPLLQGFGVMHGATMRILALGIKR